jgi:hypothetical protein
METPVAGLLRVALFLGRRTLVTWPWPLPQLLLGLFLLDSRHVQLRRILLLPEFWLIRCAGFRPIRWAEFWLIRRLHLRRICLASGITRLAGHVQEATRNLGGRCGANRGRHQQQNCAR